MKVGDKINIETPDDIHVSTIPPDNLNLTWYNPTTSRAAYGVCVDGAVLWVGILDRFVGLIGRADGKGTLTDSFPHKIMSPNCGSILITKLQASLMNWEFLCEVPVPEKRILDPGDVLKIDHWVGDDMKATQYWQTIIFKEILLVVR